MSMEDRNAPSSTYDRKEEEWRRRMEGRKGEDGGRKLKEEEEECDNDPGLIFILKVAVNRLAHANNLFYHQAF